LPLNVAGLVHAANVAASRLQTREAPESLEEKVNVALDEPLGSDGPEAIVGTAGGTVSIVHE
jgi:hypothetical protein